VIAAVLALATTAIAGTGVRGSVDLAGLRTGE
jgi:hypothetical protein